MEDFLTHAEALVAILQPPATVRALRSVKHGRHTAMAARTTPATIELLGVL
jgi:hypothetical protein